MSLLTLFALTAPSTAEDCGPDGCPLPRTEEPFYTWTAPADAAAPTIDQRPAEHLRVATFALG